MTSNPPDMTIEQFVRNLMHDSMRSQHLATLDKVIPRQLAPQYIKIKAIESLNSLIETHCLQLIGSNEDIPHTAGVARMQRTMHQNRLRATQRQALKELTKKGENT